MPVNQLENPLGGRRARTRSALFKAGLTLFAQRPVDAVPIDDIVALAGVAKGSFFNHFRDKQDFATAIAAEIRGEIEASISAANADIDDPLKRLTGGMMMAVHFALTAPEQARVMMSGLHAATARDHPLNAGLRHDIELARAKGLLREEAGEAGLLFWLGACTMVMANVTERRFTPEQAAQRMADVMLMALVGLGITEPLAKALATDAREALLTRLQ